MWEFFNFFLGLLVGVITTVLTQNRNYDETIRTECDKSIDNAVDAMHGYYSNSKNNFYRAAMDFKLGQVASDNRLKPIIGAKHFEDSFESLRGELYLHSIKNHEELDEEQTFQHCKDINETANKLKKTIRHKAGSFRLRKRG